jgi:hypothetical protein
MLRDEGLLGQERIDLFGPGVARLSVAFQATRRARRRLSERVPSAA